MYLFELDCDSAAIVLAQLDPPSLRALSCVSWQGFRLAVPALVGYVTLTRSPQQVLDFCRFVLSNHLCHHLIRLTLTRKSFYTKPIPPPARYRPHLHDVPEPHIFASSLADILEKANNLVSLAFQGCTEQLIKHESRIADAIFHHPPALSLELRGLGATSLKNLAQTSGLRHLILHMNFRPAYHQDAGEAMETVLINSAHTLETLSLRGCIPPCLSSVDASSYTWDRVHTLSLTGVPVSPQQLACSFPNLRFLSVTPLIGVTDEFVATCDSTPLAGFEVACPPIMLWPNLYSIAGIAQLALNLSRHHALRRVHLLVDVNNRNEALKRSDDFNILFEIVHNSCHLRSLALFLALGMYPGTPTPVATPLFEVGPSFLLPLARGARHLTFLSMTLESLSLELSSCLVHLVCSLCLHFGHCPLIYADTERAGVGVGAPQ
jgi:hypothetical protein